MVRSAGPLRDGEGLRAGLEALEDWPEQADPEDAEGVTAANAILTARLVVAAALLREESRGGHFRGDFPLQRDLWRAHSVQTRDRETYVIASVAPQQCVAHAAD
jgi:L-aspartate oxidase